MEGAEADVASPLALELQSSGLNDLNEAVRSLDLGDLVFRDHHLLVSSLLESSWRRSP